MPELSSVAVSTALGPPAIEHKRALTTRFVDFWLLGGASLLVWLAMMMGQQFRSAWAVDQHFKNLTVTVATMSLLVNYPHFLVSYKLAYTRGRGFVTQYWLQLIAVPVLLVAVFVYAFARYDVPVGELSLVRFVQYAINPLGGNARVFSGPRLGDLLFGL